MQPIIIVCIEGSHVLRATPASITREVDNILAISFIDADGHAIHHAGVAAWEAGINTSFNPDIPPVAVSTQATITENGVTLVFNGSTIEMGERLSGKNYRKAHATLYALDSAGQRLFAYSFAITLLNIAYDPNGPGTSVTEDTYYTKPQIDTKFAAIGDAIPAATESSRGTIALATAEEATAGTDQNKAVTPATLRPLVDAIPDDLSDLADATGILAGKVDKDGDKVLSDNNYTDADAAKVGKIGLETLAELTGAVVTIAPWTQNKWTASGICTLTASGWAASGHQIAYIVITLAAEATPSIIGTEEVAEDDALSAAGVYECYIKNVDGKKYFRVVSFTEAAS